MQNDEKPLAMAPAQVAINNLGQLVKSNLVIVAVAVLVLVALAALYFTAESLQSPEARLFSQIDLKVEEARRMLGEYNPLGQWVIDVIDTARASSTQPMAESVDQEQWPASLKTLRERVEAISGGVEPLNAKFAAWSGAPSAVSTPAGYEELKQHFETDLKRVSDALNVLQTALNESVEGPQGTITGRSHPVATQLEASLIYHKAELLRSQAAALRALRDRAVVQQAPDQPVTELPPFEDLRARWQRVQSQIAAMKAVASGQAVSMPASVDTPATAPAEPSVAAAEPPAPRPASGRRSSAVRGLIGLFSGKKGGQASPEEPPAAEPAPAEPTNAVVKEQPKAPPAEQPKPPAAPVVIKPPTPEERLSTLNAEKAKAVADIAAAETNVARLREHVSTLEKALASAEKIVSDSQLRMVQLEEKGVDPVEPGAMERFTAEYRKASEEYRAALREVAILDKGGIRNARPDTEDEQELLKAPLVPADPKQPMKPAEGLISVRAQLKAAEEQLEAHKGVLKSVEDQLAAVRRRQETDSARLALLQKDLDALTKTATEVVAKAAAATAEADKRAQDAIDLLTSQGKRAGQSVVKAAREQISDASNKRVPGVENARLELISKGTATVGHAQTLKADLALLTAYIEAERAGDLEQHARLLQQAEAMGITLAQPAEPAYASKPAAALEEASKARTQAITEAKEAYEAYREAGTSLNNLWVVNANAAAVCHLLSILQTGEEARKSRDLAIQIYRQAIEDRRDRPDAERFRRAVDSLTQATR